MAKERYISKEDYKEYEKYKADKKRGRLLNVEGLMYLAESVNFDPLKLGSIMLENMEKFKAEDPYLQNFSDAKLYFDPVTKDTDETEDFLPYVEFQK